MDDQAGTSTSSTSQRLSASEVIANVTKLEQWSLGVTDGSGQPVTTRPRQEWLDAAYALGELQMWLLGPATPTASQSTRS
jgi:hypothetical protein